MREKDNKKRTGEREGGDRGAGEKKRKRREEKEEAVRILYN